MKTVRINQTGGPEVLNYEDAPEPSPAPGQALVEIKSIGVNYTDVSSRKGTNPPDAFPWTPGREAAGVVTAVGDGVTEVAVGDRVAYAMHTGTYSQYHAVPSWLLVRIPDGMSFSDAAATMLQGMTAHFLVYGIAHLSAGDRVLVHAGAGGMGLWLIQMLKNLGIKVFTTVSTEEKAELAKGAGADHAILYTQQDFEAEILDATDGKGLKMVMDAVGATTFDKGMRLLGRRGYMALYGQAGGAVGEGGQWGPAQRVAVPDAPQPRRLHRHPRRVAATRRRRAALGAVRRGQAVRRPGTAAVRGAGGPSQDGRPRNDWQDTADALGINSADAFVVPLPAPGRAPRRRFDPPFLLGKSSGAPVPPDRTSVVGRGPSRGRG